MEEGVQGEGGGDYEGHLIAHIRVPTPYYQQQQQQQQGGDGGTGAAGGQSPSACQGAAAAAAGGVAAAPLSPGRPQLGAVGSAPSTPQRSGAGAVNAPASPQDLAAALLPAIGGKQALAGSCEQGGSTANSTFGACTSWGLLVARALLHHRCVHQKQQMASNRLEAQVNSELPPQMPHRSLFCRPALTRTSSPPATCIPAAAPHATLPISRPCRSR